MKDSFEPTGEGYILRTTERGRIPTVTKSRLSYSGAFNLMAVLVGLHRQGEPDFVELQASMELEWPDKPVFNS